MADPKLEALAKEWLKAQGGVQSWVDHYTPLLAALLERVAGEAVDSAFTRAEKQACDWLDQRCASSTENAIRHRECIEEIVAALRHQLADAQKEIERLKTERDGALDFLRKGAYVHQEIISTSRLTELQIANYRVAGMMYVEPGGGCGWVVRKIAPQIEWTEQADARWREAEERAEKAKAAVEQAREEGRKEALMLTHAESGVTIDLNALLRETHERGREEGRREQRAMDEKIVMNRATIHAKHGSKWAALVEAARAIREAK